jgi:hypothetical protein
MKTEKESGDRKLVNETIETEVLAASVAGKETATITVHLEGTFERPGVRVTIPPIVVMMTVPAKVTP